jgi:hypothetical protein
MIKNDRNTPTARLSTIELGGNTYQISVQDDGSLHIPEICVVITKRNLRDLVDLISDGGYNYDILSEL